MSSNESLIERIRNGEEYLKEELILKNSPLIYKLISEFYYLSNYTDLKDDLYQAGNLGLLKALNRYNGSFGTKFTTFAFKYIKGEILRVVESELNRDLTFTEVFSEEGDTSDSFFEDVADYVNNVFNGNYHSTEETAINSVIKEDIFTTVTPLQKTILRLRYFEDRTQTEIGERLGIHQVEVSREEQRARRLVLKEFQGKKTCRS